MATTGDNNATGATAPRPIINGHVPGARPPRPPRTAWKTAIAVVAIVVLAIVGVGLGMLARALKAGRGESGGPKNVLQTMQDIGQIAVDPRAGFPGKSRVVICCMGIDDNWTSKDEVFTAGARTDTLFLLTLDLDTKRVTVLSIPRDTYAHIAGTDFATKINDAYPTGGPERTEATIDQWLGVEPDYYIVLNINATKRLVDALGGVNLDVEHEMDYDDSWGHLHVHLHPGFQHLDGEQAVGFARFRHGNHGVTPEDGDERRMYRQHVLLRAMIQKAETFQNVMQVNSLLDIGMSCIRTNLSRTQLFDIAAMFHSINPVTGVTAASLDGANGTGPHGEYVMLVDRNLAEQYVQWLVDGDEAAGRALTPVHIYDDAGSPAAAARAEAALRAAGYTSTFVEGSGPVRPRTLLEDNGVPNHDADQDVPAALGLSNVAVMRHPPEPNNMGWTPPPFIRVDLGADYASAAPS